jgi:cupin fold WbuC family metalloprotein
MIEEVRDTATMEGSEGVLAIVVTADHRVRAPVEFVTAPTEPQQVAVMSHRAGTVIPPHRHHERRREVTRTSEVLLVRRGKVRVDIYTSAGEWVATRVLGAGDLVVLQSGGHSLTFEDDTELVEVKQGPYEGREKDKVNLFIPPRVSPDGTVRAA